jgi:hypothetical protein
MTQKILSFDEFLFEAESQVYKSAGDPYSYKVIDGVWFTKGPKIPNWKSLKGNKASADILNKRFPNALKTSTTQVKSKEIPDSINPEASLLFDGEKLVWSIKKGSLTSEIKSWDAVSGLSFLNAGSADDWWKLAKSFVQSPETFSKEKNAGPTPPGKYLVGMLEARQGMKEPVSGLRAAYKKFFTDEYDNPTAAEHLFQNSSEYSRISWGNYRAPIYPLPGTNTYGRGGFYVHGGTFPGSHGCIDLTSDMDDFGKFYGKWLAANPTKKGIPLTVQYPESWKNEVLDWLWSANEIKNVDLPTDSIAAAPGTFDDVSASDYSNIA